MARLSGNAGELIFMASLLWWSKLRIRVSILVGGFYCYVVRLIKTFLLSADVLRSDVESEVSRRQAKLLRTNSLFSNRSNDLGRELRGLRPRLPD